MQKVNPDTGEIYDDGVPAAERVIEQAADGGYVPGACNSFGEFVASLEEGQFDADLYAQVKELSESLQEHAAYNGGKAKGKVTLVLELVQEAQITKIKASFKVVKPEAPRLTSIMWATEDGRYSRRQPGQGQLFGVQGVATRDPEPRAPGGYRDV